MILCGARCCWPPETQLLMIVTVTWLLSSRRAILIRRSMRLQALQASG